MLLEALLRNEFKSFAVRFTTCVQTCLAKNQVVESCVNIDFWLDKITRESLHTWDLRHIIPKRFASVKAPFHGSHSSEENIEPLERA